MVLEKSFSESFKEAFEEGWAVKFGALDVVRPLPTYTRHARDVTCPVSATSTANQRRAESVNESCHKMSNEAKKTLLERTTNTTLQRVVPSVG